MICDDNISKRKVLTTSEGHRISLCELCGTSKNYQIPQAFIFRVPAHHIPTLDTLIKFPIFLTTWVLVGCCSSLDSDEKKILSYCLILQDLFHSEVIRAL